MKATIAQPTSINTPVELDELFVKLSDTSYAIDLVTKDKKVLARHLIEQQMVGVQMRLINKLCIAPEPTDYKNAQKLDITGWTVETAAMAKFVDLSSLLVPAEPEANPSATAK